MNGNLEDERFLTNRKRHKTQTTRSKIKQSRWECEKKRVFKKNTKVERELTD